jgi:hypothetical protein
MEKDIHVSHKGQGAATNREKGQGITRTRAGAAPCKNGLTRTLPITPSEFVPIGPSLPHFYIVTCLYFVFSQSNTMGATCGAGTATPPEHLSLPLVFSGVHVTQSLVLCVIFCRSLFVLLFFFFWPLCCLSFFDLQILISSLWYLQTLLELVLVFKYSWNTACWRLSNNQSINHDPKTCN